MVGKLAHLAEGVKDVVEVDQDLPFSDLSDVVHGLAGVVPNTGILVSEAGENWWDDNLKVSSKFLRAAAKAQSRVSREVGFNQSRR
jgi:hypothetical protein